MHGKFEGEALERTGRIEKEERNSLKRRKFGGGFQVFLSWELGLQLFSL